MKNKSLLIASLLLNACNPADLTKTVDASPEAPIASPKKVEPIAPIVSAPGTDPVVSSIDLTRQDNQRFEWNQTHNDSYNTYTMSRDGLVQTMDYDDSGHVFVTLTASNDNTQAACTVTYKFTVSGGNAISLEVLADAPCTNSWVDHQGNGSTQTNALSFPNSNYASAIPFGMTIQEGATSLTLTWSFPSTNPHFPAPTVMTETYQRRL